MQRFTFPAAWAKEYKTELQFIDAPETLYYFLSCILIAYLVYVSGTQTVVLSNARDTFHTITEWLKLEQAFGVRLVQHPPAEADCRDLIVWDPGHWSPLIQ